MMTFRGLYLIQGLNQRLVSSIDYLTAFDLYTNRFVRILQGGLY